MYFKKLCFVIILDYRNVFTLVRVIELISSFRINIKSYIKDFYVINNILYVLDRFYNFLIFIFLRFQLLING